MFLRPHNYGQASTVWCHNIQGGTGYSYLVKLDLVEFLWNKGMEYTHRDIVEN